MFANVIKYKINTLRQNDSYVITKKKRMPIIRVKYDTH